MIKKLFFFIIQHDLGKGEKRVPMTLMKIGLCRKAMIGSPQGSIAAVLALDMQEK
jgi:hypothetical protein